MAESREGGIPLVEILILGVLVMAMVAGVRLWFQWRSSRVPRGSEGLAGVGSIRTAMRVYAAGHNNTYPVLTNANGKQLAVIGITQKDLKGKYFRPKDYLVNSTATTYTIRATLPGGGPTDFYEINQDGVENAGGYTTGN